MNPDKKTLDDLRIDRSRPRSRRSAAPIVIGVLLLLAIAAAVIWWSQRARAIPVSTILVQQAASGSEGTLLNASGYVTARRAATVSAKITGKVIEVLVEEGMRVEAGQLLARLDSSNVERSLRVAEAQLESARKALGETKANLDQAERELRRISDLARAKIASASELDRADAEAKSLTARIDRQNADVAVAEQQVALWKQQLDDTTIRAPFAGIVTSKDAQPGEMVSPVSAGGGFTRTGICTIVDMNSLEIEVDVNESYINRVEPGQPVEARLDSYPDWRIPAKVIAIIPTADRQKATVKVRVAFEKLDPRILPDMGVKVAFQRSAATPTTATGVVIPRKAIRPVENRDVVWIVRDGKVERRAVTIAATRDAEVTIAAGLNGGERIVVEGGEKLVDGAEVTESKK